MKFDTNQHTCSLGLLTCPCKIQDCMLHESSGHKGQTSVKEHELLYVIFKHLFEDESNHFNII